MSAENRSNNNVALQELDYEDIIDQIEKLLVEQDVMEVDFMPTMGPPFVLFAERTIGIAMPLLKKLYGYTYRIFMQLLLESPVEKALHNKNGDSIINDYDRYTKIILLIKGDLSIAYNTRKRLILIRPNLLSRELGFVSVVFSKHPKSPSGWEHRRWCYRQKHNNISPFILLPGELISERELTQRMADKYPKNYYAWMHRLWLLQFMSSQQLEEEMMFTLSWLESHTSDHSAVNHRIQLISKILSDKAQLEFIQNTNDSEIKDLICTQLSFLTRLILESNDLVKKRPGRESLWCYKRLLFTLYLRHTVSSTNPAIQQNLQQLVRIVAQFKKENQIDDLEESSQVVEDDAMDATESSRQLNYLRNEIVSELQHVLLVFDNKDVDNYHLQKTHALEYLEYLQDRLEELISVRT